MVQALDEYPASHARVGYQIAGRVSAFPFLDCVGIPKQIREPGKTVGFDHGIQDAAPVK
ncbi:hypothetical protein FA13DRAFT_1736900 [Coprinellus micaceus]|uniref:Uncharacterized protein n=1 Tax=Coprinellus micaceus TaxID=71717 RepID=A0A4Y7SZN6_COPMI|nr:hypothetical protein FA13DRAFT_1736900 [Coprinellus micaceus]